MTARHQSLDGVFAPVLTPFTSDLSPDPELFVRFCRWLTGKGVGLAVFGTTSEANSLSVDEKITLLDRLVEAGIAPETLMPGTGACALPDTVKLTAAAVRHGARAVLMLPPFYYKNVSEDGLFGSFAEVIERVGDERLRVCLYHIPQISGVAITPSLIEGLRKRYPDTVVGLKDSSGDWVYTSAIIEQFPDFRVFPGSESFLLRGMRQGAAGCISATANINPAAIRALFDNWQSPMAETQQAKLDTVRNTFQPFPMIPALKRIVANNSGQPSFATVRPPLSPLTSDDSRHLEAALSAVGLTTPGLADALSA